MEDVSHFITKCPLIAHERTQLFANTEPFGIKDADYQQEPVLVLLVEKYFVPESG